MGNMLGTIASQRTDIFMGVAVLSLIAYLVWNAKEKKKHREQMLKKFSKDVEIKLNEVYLKDNVDHLSIRQSASHAIYKIAITGGPCAGKTSAIQHVRKHFSDKGFRVFAVPEVPTMVVLAGGMILMAKFNAQERMKFQSLLIRFQMYMEDYITKLADMSKQPSIVLCDRGTMDPQAYISRDQFQSILDEEGWSKVVLRDRRYDRVCCLASAANGAEKYYTLENNVARTQGIEVARILDKKTLEAWIGHPHLSIIPNVKGETFGQKLDRVVEAINKTVGIQVPKAYYAKVLVNKPDYPKDLLVEFGVRFDVFLENDDERYEEDKITKWGQDRSFVYQRKYREVRKDIGDYSREIRRHLTSTQYVMLRENSDKRYAEVIFKRAKFAWKNSTFTVDNIKIDEQDAYILRFYCKKEDAMGKVPEFFNPIREVTKEKRYTTKYIALVEK